MEELLLRIPGLGENIFSQLDNKSLADCKKVCKTWNNFISDQKFPSIRLIQKHVTNFDESWKKAVTNTSADMVKKLATAVETFFTPDPKRILELTKRESDEFLPLHVVAESGSRALFKHIIEKNGNKNVPTKEGWTPLHYAAVTGNLKKFKLVDANDKNPKSIIGITPLHFAALCGSLKIAKLIVENVEDKNPANKNGLTPLYVAANHGHFDICKLIVENMVDKNPAYMHILADQLTLSQPGGADYAHHITTGTFGFSDLPMALPRWWRETYRLRD